MSDTTTQLHEFTGLDVWLGFKQLLPLALFVLVFGMAFGLAAIQSDMSPAAAMLMSTVVFAGAAQFATLEFWGTQVPLVTLIFTVFAVNARHILMGVTLYPWLRHLPPLRRYGVAILLSDANWAMSMQAFNRGRPGVGIVLGGGIALWLFWAIGTWLGTHFGAAIQDAKSLGLDMVMGCFLLAMVVEGDKSLHMLFIWLGAASTALLAYWYLPDNSHVVVGALAGGVLGVLWPEKQA